MHKHTSTATILLTIALATPTQAQTPPTIATTITGTQQTARDSERINILHAELTEQKQHLADAQKTRAVQMAANDTEALAKTENRLEELSANINQLQQEIALAEGSTNKTVVVKPVTVPATKAVATAQKTEVSSPWWDLYNRPPQDAQ